MGKSEEAIAVYDELVTLDSKNKEVIIYMAKALYGKGACLEYLGKSEETIAVCREIICLFKAS
ncbi:MAG: hypothetical protein H6Q69_1715 [Firmicutes bacterium]|nr:hypothetical protein [Bacillota bacterium]